mmetsp:Transcript_38167/g.82152  ORF Transcript_38167/g.82152 Transcript_38167/m.82152 type:complete len:207 (+) Transcript_38167:48-668(+)
MPSPAVLSLRFPLRFHRLCPVREDFQLLLLGRLVQGADLVLTPRHLGNAFPGGLPPQLLLVPLPHGIPDRVARDFRYPATPEGGLVHFHDLRLEAQPPAALPTPLLTSIPLLLQGELKHPLGAITAGSRCRWRLASLMLSLLGAIIPVLAIVSIVIILGIILLLLTCGTDAVHVVRVARNLWSRFDADIRWTGRTSFILLGRCHAR